MPLGRLHAKTHSCWPPSNLRPHARKLDDDDAESLSSEVSGAEFSEAGMSYLSTSSHNKAGREPRDTEQDLRGFDELFLAQPSWRADSNSSSIAEARAYEAAAR